MTENRDPVQASPKISRISWGVVSIEGIELPFRDVKLFPGGAREWDWRETGTSHKPGIQPADVEELVQKGATAIVLSIGVDGMLKVMPETLAYLNERDVTVHILPTPEAVSVYNDLAESQSIGALIHSTC